MILLRVLIIQVDLTDFTNYSWLHRIFSAINLLGSSVVPVSSSCLAAGEEFKAVLSFSKDLLFISWNWSSFDFMRRIYISAIVVFWVREFRFYIFDFLVGVFDFRDPWFLGSDLAGTVWYNLSRYLFEAKTSTLEVLMRRLFGQLQQLSARQLFLFHMFWK